MEYNIVVSNKAKQMLGNHLNFLSTVNKSAAKDTKQKIINSLNSLNKTPARFPFFNEQYIPQNKYHKMYIENWYLVLFQIKDSTVYIDYIVDCRQDYGWLIK
jgi:hypothetical protein